jgi:hypothetical protein
MGQGFGQTVNRSPTPVSMLTGLQAGTTAHTTVMLLTDAGKACVRSLSGR